MGAIVDDDQRVTSTTKVFDSSRESTKTKVGLPERVVDEGSEGKGPVHSQHLKLDDRAHDNRHGGLGPAPSSTLQQSLCAEPRICLASEALRYVHGGSVSGRAGPIATLVRTRER